MRTEIYTTDTDSGSITVLERHGQGDLRPVARIPIGNAPRGAVKFTKDGRGFVSNCAGDTISEIDTLTYREAERIKVGVAPRGIGIVPGDRYALVSNSGSNTVSVVDLNKRQEVHQVAVGRDPRHMAITPDGKFAYVCVWASHYISKIDISALMDPEACGKIRDITEVKRIALGEEAHPYSAAIVPGRPMLFVANTQSQRLSIVDLTKDEVVGSIDLGHKGARAVAFDAKGDMAFVSVEDTSEVVMVDVEHRKVVKRIAVGPGPRGIAYDSADATIYCSVFARSTGNVTVKDRFHANTVTVVSLGTGKNLLKSEPTWHEVPVGKGPCSVSILKR